MVGFINTWPLTKGWLQAEKDQQNRDLFNISLPAVKAQQEYLTQAYPMKTATDQIGMDKLQASYDFGALTPTEVMAKYGNPNNTPAQNAFILNQYQNEAKIAAQMGDPGRAQELLNIAGINTPEIRDPNIYAENLSKVLGMKQPDYVTNQTLKQQQEDLNIGNQIRKQDAISGQIMQMQLALQRLENEGKVQKTPKAERVRNILGEVEKLQGGLASYQKAVNDNTLTRNPEYERAMTEAINNKLNEQKMVLAEPEQTSQTVTDPAPYNPSNTAESMLNYVLRGAYMASPPMVSQATNTTPLLASPTNLQATTPTVAPIALPANAGQLMQSYTKRAPVSGNEFTATTPTVAPVTAQSTNTMPVTTQMMTDNTMNMQKAMSDIDGLSAIDLDKLARNINNPMFLVQYPRLNSPQIIDYIKRKSLMNQIPRQ